MPEWRMRSLGEVVWDRGRLWTALFAGLCLFASAVVRGEEPLSDLPVVRIDFFFEQGCADCARVRQEALPVLQAAMDGFYELHEWDVGNAENHRLLLGLLTRTEVPLSDNATVYMFVDRVRPLIGADDIVANLLATAEAQLSLRMSADVRSLEPQEIVPVEEEDVVRIAKRFTPAGVAAAGLVDGINPCAIATLVFLISVLSLSNVAGGNLAMIGAAFCAGSFLTYFLIGLGLLHVLHELAAFRRIQGVFDILLFVILLLLAVYSFLDAFRFRRSHRSADIAIQLPANIKNRVHKLLRLGLGRHGTIVSAFLIAMAVTALESVCTGQVYLPTLAFIVRSGAAVNRGIGLLVLYNLMFILPLIVVLVLVHHGLRLQRLMAWSAKEVFYGKLLMGVFFVVMAVLVVLM